jgi:hypothetical protein
VLADYLGKLRTGFSPSIWRSWQGARPCQAITAFWRIRQLHTMTEAVCGRRVRAAQHDDMRHELVFAATTRRRWQCMSEAWSSLCDTLHITMQDPLSRPDQPYRITVRADLIGPASLILQHVSSTRLPSSTSRSGRLGHNEAEFQGPHVIAQHSTPLRAHVVGNSASGAPPEKPIDLMRSRPLTVRVALPGRNP